MIQNFLHKPGIQDKFEFVIYFETSENDFHIKLYSTDMSLSDKTYNIYYSFMFYSKIKYPDLYYLIPRFNILQELAFSLVKLLKTGLLIATTSVLPYYLGGLVINVRRTP